MVSITHGSHIIIESPHTLSQTQESWAKNMASGKGKGRGEIQKGFESVNNTVNSTVRYINNFLK